MGMCSYLINLIQNSHCAPLMIALILLMWFCLLLCQTFRMPIIDKFKEMGTVVMGKVESGSVREGDSLLVMPNKVSLWFLFSLPRPQASHRTKWYLPNFLLLTDNFLINVQAHVKVLEVYCDEDKVRQAGPGENLRVKLSGIEEDGILSGFVLSSIGNFPFWILNSFLCSSWKSITNYFLVLSTSNFTMHLCNFGDTS